MDGSNVLGEYVYNGNGQRADKLIPLQNKCTVFHYDQNGLLISESTRTGNIKAEYVYLNGQPLAKIENNNIYYYHNDHLGTPMLMTDSSGSVVWSGEFKPFGEPLSITGSITNNLRFPGQYFDSETGLHQNGYRDYKPEIGGRYLQADPIGLRGGMNLFTYVGNDPVNWVDPWGLFLEKIWNDPVQRAKHKNTAITMREFINYTRGKSPNEIQHDIDKNTRSDRSAGGPETSYRYVINPKNPNQVIDMRHFFVVGPQEEIAGLMIELLQLSGDRASAFDAQDFLSNALGKNFFSKYDSTRPLDYQLEKYFYGVIGPCSK